MNLSTRFLYRICWLLGLLVAVIPVRSQPPNEAVFMFPLRQLVGDRYETVEEADFKKQVFRVRKNGLYGLIDEHGREQVAPQYEHMGYFGLSLMAVRKGKKWGALNRRGELVIPIKYDEIGQNNDSRFVEVRKDSLWAAFNEAGKMLTSFEYAGLNIRGEEMLCWPPGNADPFLRDSAGNRFAVEGCNIIEPLFGGGWMACRKGQYAIFDADRRQLTDFIFPGRVIRLPGNRVAAGGRWGDDLFLYDFEGNMLLDTAVQILHRNSSIWVSIPGIMHGFLQRDGSFVDVAANVALYGDWENAEDNLTQTFRKTYVLREDWEITYLHGWVDTRTGRAVPANFKEVIFRDDKVFAYRADTSLTDRADTTFVYSREGRLLRTFPFHVSFFPRAAVGFYYQNERYGLMDSTFQPITPPQFEGLQAADWGGFLFWKNGKQGLIDQQGKELLPPMYDRIVPAEPNGQRLRVTVGGKTSLVDWKGSLMMEAVPFDSVQLLPNGHLVIGLAGKYGLISRAGTVLLPMEYDSLQADIRSRVMLLRRDGRFGLADFQGKILLPFLFEWLDLQDYRPWVVGEKDGLLGAWAKDGASILLPEYQRIEWMNNLCLLRKNDHYGLCNYQGQVLTPLIYDTIWQENLPLSFSGAIGDSVVRWFEYWDRASRSTVLMETRPNIQGLKYAEYGSTFRQNGKTGLIDLPTEQVILPPVYDQLLVTQRPQIFAIARRGASVELLKHVDGTLLMSFAADSFHLQDIRFLNFWRNQVPYLFDLFHLKEYRLADPFDLELLRLPAAYSLLPFHIKSPTRFGPNTWLLLFSPASYRYGCYNPDTQVFLPALYQSIQPLDSVGFMLVRKDNRYAIFNPDGEAVSNFEFEYVEHANQHCFKVRQDGKYALYSKDMKAAKCLTPISLDYMEIEHDCFITTRKDRKGLIAPDGRELLPTGFNHVGWAGGDCWIGWGRDSKVGVIKTDGTTVLPFEYSWIGADYPHGFILSKSKKMGLSDFAGKLLLPIEYDEITPVEGQPGTYRTIKNGEIAIFKR